MRRIVTWGAVGTLIAALVGVGFAHWPLSAAKVGDSLNAALGPSPRLHWSAPQAASFSALPWPSVRIVDAEINDAYGVNVLTAPEARLDLSLVQLLRGRFIPTRVALASPTMTIDLDRPPFAGRGVSMTGTGSVSRALAPLGALSFSNGLLHVASGKRGLDTLIANVRGRLDGLMIGDQLRFNLSAVWRNAPVTVAGTLGDPEAAANGEPSPFTLALDSPTARFGFDGALAGGGAPSAEGEVTASVDSIAALTALLDAPRPAGLASDDIAIVAKIKATPEALALSDATLTSAGQTFEGALEIAEAGGRPLLSGTFATDEAALAPLVGSPQRLIDGNGGWSAKAFAFRPPRAFDLDLRLSAARLDVYGRKLLNAAASVIVKDGRLTANLIEAAAYDGRLEGEVSLWRDGQALDLRARAELADADLGAAFADLGPPLATGRGGARFAIETSGVSPEAAIAALKGSASFEAADGAIAGVNLEEALRRGQRRPLDLGRDLPLGGATFDTLVAAFAFKDGQARIERGDMTSRGMAAGAEGLIDLVTRSFNLRINAVQTDAAGEESQNAARLTLRVDGPWSAPTIRAIGGGDGEPSGDQATPPLR